MAALVAALAFTKPATIVIPVFINTGLWFWLMLVFGFGGVMSLYADASVWLRLLIICLFINCFTSAAPYISFIIYGTTVFCFYFYLIGCKFADFKPVLNTVQAIFFLNVILVVMQQFGKDTLFNFALDEPIWLGTMGTRTELGSMITCLAPFLVISSPLNAIPVGLMAWLSKSMGAMVSLGFGAMAYGMIRLKSRIAKAVLILAISVPIAIHMVNNGRWEDRLRSGRWPVWKRTVQLANERPWTGWGIGTYKLIFSVKAPEVAGGMMPHWNYKGTSGDWVRWVRTHNCWLQILFETGWTGFILVIGFIAYLLTLFRRMHKTREIAIATAGLVVIAVDMAVHFPTRMPQTILLLVCFLAYYEALLKGRLCDG